MWLLGGIFAVGIGLDSEPGISISLNLFQADVAPITLRTRKFITNRLLSRRQFVVDVLHPDRPNVSKADLSQKLAALYKTEPQRVVIFHSQTQYGGGKSTAFALIYDDEASQKKFEPKHRLIRVCTISIVVVIRQWLLYGQSGLQTKPPIVSRKLRKERKNRAKKVFSLLCYLDQWSYRFSSVVPKSPRRLKPLKRNNYLLRIIFWPTHTAVSFVPSISWISCILWAMLEYVICVEWVSIQQADSAKMRWQVVKVCNIKNKFRIQFSYG